jgi:hypothetical protein
MAVMDIRLGDTYRLRKPHPCGGYDWQVTRVGADIGLRCLTCDRRVMLARPEFERRVKRLLTRPETPDAVPAAGNPGSTTPRP